MDPSTVFCPTKDCRDKGRQGRGNIGIHRQKKQRYRCMTCGKTFAATRGTALYRLHHPAGLMVLVVTLLCHGCPVPAIVAAFGLNERTVAAWLHRAVTRRGCIRPWWRQGRWRSFVGRYEGKRQKRMGQPALL